MCAALKLRAVFVPFLLAAAAAVRFKDSTDPSGLVIRVASRPDTCSHKAFRGDTLHVHYMVSTPEGKQLAASISDGKPWGPMVLGNRDAIEAYDIGLEGMCIGETRILFAPPALAYGEEGYARYGILPNATLHFQVTLIELQKRLQIQVLKEVDCLPHERTATGSTISVHYTGRLQANGRKFESSYDKTPATPWGPFTIGANQAIQGYEQGLLSMCVGERRRLTVPPELAYGDEGSGESIPPGATLVFDVDLMNLETDTLLVNVVPPSCSFYAQAGDTVSLEHRVTSLHGTTRYMHSTRSMTLGNTSVLDKSVMEMCEGEKRTLTLAPRDGPPVDLGDILDLPEWETVKWEIELHTLDKAAMSIQALPGSDWEIKACGPGVQPNSTASVHFNISLQSGEAAFSTLDELRIPNGPHEFQMGDGSTIEGLERGILSMCPGSRRRLVIPSHLAYGPAGLIGVVPGNTTIVLDVELQRHGFQMVGWPQISD